jgi:hypothetical protein
VVWHAPLSRSLLILEPRRHIPSRRRASGRSTRRSSSPMVTALRSAWSSGTRRWIRIRRLRRTTFGAVHIDHATPVEPEEDFELSVGARGNPVRLLAGWPASDRSRRRFTPRFLSATEGDTVQRRHETPTRGAHGEARKPLPHKRASSREQVRRCVKRLGREASTSSDIQAAHSTAANSGGGEPPEKRNFGRN